MAEETPHPYTVAVTFARGGSRGLPGKNIKPLAGKPMIAYAIEAGLACSRIDRVIVSTDSEEIATVALACGADVPFMRPVALASDTAPEWLSWRHALETLEASDPGRKIERIISVPATSPLRQTQDIDAAIDAYERSGADAVICVTEAFRNPYFNMVRIDENGYAEVAMRSDPPVGRRQDAPTFYDMTTMVYVLDANLVRHANSIWEGRIVPVIVPRERALDIDDVFDFRIAKFFLESSCGQQES